MTTYHKQYPGAGSFVRVIAKTDEGSREIAQCSGPVIGAVNSFNQATEDADRIVAALNAYQPVGSDTLRPLTPMVIREQVERVLWRGGLGPLSREQASELARQIDTLYCDAR